jgi:hypothetical protein
MPFVGLYIGVRKAAARVIAKVAAAGAAVKFSFHRAIKWVVDGTTRASDSCSDFVVNCGNSARGRANSVRVKCLTIKDWTMMGLRILVAHAYRYWYLVGLLISVAAISYFTCKYWPEVPKPAPVRVHYHHVVHPKPPPPPPPPTPDVVHRLLPRESDTRNADFYYLINIIFVPLQTMILLIGGGFALWTLSQNHKFKQHDVEAKCIEDYLAIEQQLIDAGNDAAKIVSAVRAYWILMLYEYYWWRQGLLSRDLFANWCEFRVQRFEKKPDYAFGTQGTRLPFKNYLEGYAYFKNEKVFRSPSLFDDLMLALIDRAGKKVDKRLQWFEIERYRHGFGAGI